jgi:hypothetical protein
MATKKSSASAADGDEFAEKPMPVVDERKSAAGWAEAAGHLPQWLQESTVGARMNPAYWKFAATKALMGWEDGTQMTRSEYEAAVAKQGAVRHG